MASTVTGGKASDEKMPSFPRLLVVSGPVAPIMVKGKTRLEGTAGPGGFAHLPRKTAEKSSPATFPSRSCVRRQLTHKARSGSTGL